MMQGGGGFHKGGGGFSPDLSGEKFYMIFLDMPDCYKGREGAIVHHPARGGKPAWQNGLPGGHYGQVAKNHEG